jgi:acid ceramidase
MFFRAVISCVVLFAGTTLCREPPSPFSDNCIVNDGSVYNPSKANDTKWFDIDLDKPPKERWTEIAGLYKEGIADLLYVIKNLSAPLFHGKLIQFVDNYFPEWEKRIPMPYTDELRGIADATGLEMGEIVLYNVFYEIFSVCTSIVAQDDKGKMYHARNMDFGLFMEWDAQMHGWGVTDRLRKIIFNVRWMKGGKVVYKSVNFAGYIGVYNAVKEGKFTVTMNERFGIAGGYVGLIQWLLGLTPNVKFSTYLVRETMEKAGTFTEATEMLRTERIMAPCYYIVGGTQPGEGVVITRGLKGTDEENWMNSTGWYVLQTNYDPSKKPFYIDDRRTPGNQCMQKLGTSRVGFEGLFNVLSSKTNLNMLTAYAVLMQVDTGDVETYVMKCEQPCWFA